MPSYHAVPCHYCSLVHPKPLCYCVWHALQHPAPGNSRFGLGQTRGNIYAILSLSLFLLKEWCQLGWRIGRLMCLLFKETWNYTAGVPGIILFRSSCSPLMPLFQFSIIFFPGVSKPSSISGAGDYSKCIRVAECSRWKWVERCSKEPVRRYFLPILCKVSTFYRCETTKVL